MQTKFYSSILLFVLCFGFFKASADDVPTQILSGAIKKAHADGVSFTSVNLFTNTTGEKHPNTLREETLLLPNTSAIENLYNNYPKAITVTLKADNGREYTLELMRSTPLAYQPDMGYIDANGRHKVNNFETGAHYQGAVKGVDKSVAALSAFANGEVMVLFATDEGNFVVGKLDDNSGRFVFYNDKNFLHRPANMCGVNDADYPTDGQNSGNKTTSWYQCNKVSIYWEADYDTYLAKLSNVTITTNYLTGLFNQVQAMYRNEQVAVELKSVYVWTIADNYDTATSNDGLNSFKGRWNAVGDTFNGNLAMLLARDQKGNGGIAFVGVLCSKNTAYAYGDINAAFNTIPTYSWDVEMVTHEHGHNIGSKHTHWCGWNTGAGGSCGAIDNCTTLETTGSCPSCPYYQYDNSLPTGLWQGTVMSYCHLVTRGINLSNGFGPLPGNKIRTSVAGASCLSSIISVTLTPKNACTADGAVTLTFDTSTIGSSNFSCAPYRFTWSSGPTTQSISGLKDPGTYTVAIEDSNGCKKSFSTTVNKDLGPGCWQLGINTTNGHDSYVSVYPNPAHSSVSIKYFAAAGGENQLKITDVLGRVVYTKDMTTAFGENNLTIPTENWTKGVYHIQLAGDNTHYNTVKLLIE